LLVKQKVFLIDFDNQSWLVPGHDEFCKTYEANMITIGALSVGLTIRSGPQSITGFGFVWNAVGSTGALGFILASSGPSRWISGRTQR